uniref:Peptidase M14 domain-containing protein n=1 Tax=Rhodosorus marinus TaxID=101924 RepID=A0A7S2ZPR3_9RHOD|mmetsp:Transcript_26957/g.104770  ORF Transcript_26957/g.104770 Transcript_26957/m.104770 type:complete len:590 (+) Transcript_26957:4516-6285(+)
MGTVWKATVLCLWLACVLSKSSAEGRGYKYLAYHEIQESLQKAAKLYPRLAKLESAQEVFDLPSVGNCTNDQGLQEDCRIWILEITNWDTRFEDRGRPHMLVSGEVHGDEVVGPQVAVEFINLLLSNYGKDEKITRLIDTRVITIVPTANAYGYETQTRGELHSDRAEVLDPNRDFAFDQDPDMCMRTVAGRTINELFLTHFYRILITFHGGTNVIGYEWGDTAHCRSRVCTKAPDNLAMVKLSNRMREYAGKAGGYESEYKVGDMGSTVYPVRGGMEDWGYGASWNDRIKCNPRTLGGYDQERTDYRDGSHRCLSFLVETGREKRPDEQKLGTDEEPLVTGGKGDGHVPRNLRLLMAAADALEPYVALKNVTVDANNLSCTWYVGGAFVVPKTRIEVAYPGEMYRLTSHMAAGNGSFPFAGKMSMFSKSIKVRTRGSVYLRAVTFDTDSDLARNMGSGEPQSHFVQSRSDPDWFYETNFSRVQGSTVFQSKTLHVSLETGEKLDDDVTGIDWDKLPIEDGDSLDEPEDDDHHDGLEDGDKNLLPEPVLLSMVHHQVRSRRYSSLQDNEYYDGDSEDLEDDEMPLQRYP